MFKSTRLVLVCATAFLISLGVLAPVAGAAITGTIAIGNTGNGTIPEGFGALGVSSSGLAFERVTSGQPQGWFGLPSGTSTPISLTDLPTNDFSGGALVSGDLAVVTTGGSTISWETLAGTSGATAPTIPASNPSFTPLSQGISAGPGGWLAFGASTSTHDTHLLLVTTTGTVTDLGDVTSLDSTANSWSVIAGPDGAVAEAFTYSQTSSSLSAYYVPFADAGSFTTLAVPSSISSGFGSCATVLASDVVCANGADVALIPLNASTATTLTLSTAPTSGVVTGTSSYVAYIDNGNVLYESWAGGSVSAFTSTVGLPAAVMTTDGTGFVFAGGNTLTNNGIAEGTPPTTAATTILSVSTASPVAATELSLAPNTALWSDDAPASGLSPGSEPIWSRSLSNNSGTLSAGSESPVLTDASDYSFAPVVGPQVSGNRYLYLNSSGNLVLRDTASSPATTLTNASGENDPIGFLSGSRALYLPVTGTTTGWQLYDAVTGTGASANLPAGASPALWGDYIAYMNTDGSVDRIDLSTNPPTTTTVLGAQVDTSTGGDCYNNGEGGPGIMVFGDYVAWSEDCYATSGTTTPTEVSGYADVTSGTTPVNLSSTSVPVALSENYIATIPLDTYMQAGSPAAAVTATNLNNTSSTTAVGDATGSVKLEDSTIAWIDQNGEPEAAPLPTVPDVPRYLGDGTAPTTFSTAGGATWDGEWDTSAPLTTCHVTISQSSTTVATVPCNTTDMPLGDAIVSWNGTNTGGTTVSSGTYDWSLTASNASGVLESPSGGAMTLSGSIAVGSSLTSTTTTLAPSANPAALGQSVTYTASVSPTPDTGTVTFTDTTTSTTICNAVALTAGSATCSATYAAVASHTITATYSGSTEFAGSTSATLDESVARGTPTVSASAPSTANYGTAVTYGATVHGVAGADSPTGTVTFSSGTTALCTTPDLSSGSASCSSAAAPAGVDTVTASYGGDANYVGGTGSTTVTVSVTPPSAPAGSTNVASASSTSPTGTATASGGNVTASGSGIGALTVATYNGNPTTGTVSGGTGAYYDVAIGTGSTFSSVTILVCNQGAGESLQWWNGSVWTEFSNQTVFLGCLGATVTATTSPTLAQLTGTPIAVSSNPPSSLSAYREVASDGGIFDYGGAGFYGSTGGTPLNAPIVGMADTPGGGGYWLVASDGGIFAYGDAKFYGSRGGQPLDKPIVGMAATPDGKGYWLVASDGGIFAYGDAKFYGSTGGTVLNKPVVGMATTQDGDGYWLVASDGGIFAYGDAKFYGSTGSMVLNKPVVGMAPTHDGDGYWLVASDGGIFAYGDAKFYGSTGSLVLNKPVVGMAATPDGKGYWLVASDGGIFSYGDAGFSGSTGGIPLNKPVVGMAG